MDNKYRCLPFWSWNDELDEAELVRQIDWMHERGIGGFFMHARGGLTTPYLGEKWFSCVEACLKRAKELGMEAYAYDENGWPSGFAGGKLLEDPDNRDRYLTWSYGPYDPEAYVCYDASGEELKRVTEGENLLRVYEHISVSTADILNKNVVRKFIEITHEEYKKHDIYGNLKGFFTDEPQYHRWAHPYTRVLPDYFLKKYGMDIKDGLGLLFVEKEGYREFRYRYWKAMQDLMLNSFAKQIYDWCDGNGYQFTGHYIDEICLEGSMLCCAGVMPFYEYEHIPGIDWLCRPIGTDLPPRQVGSVAAQLGKKQVLTETFAMVGWDATPQELKHIAEYQYVNGVNLMCQHLLPYSEHGQRKRDYPEHYSAINPWAEADFKEFNDYFSYLGEKLAESREIVNVGVFWPIRSCYFDYKRSGPNPSIRELNDRLLDAVKLLGKKHIPYHLIDEVILQKHGSVEGKKLRVGLCSYDYLIFPKTLTMDVETEAILKEYVQNGGKVLLMDEKPSFLEGKPHSYDYLETNTSIEEVLDSQGFFMSEDPEVRVSFREDRKGRFLYIVNLGEERDIRLNGYLIHLEKWESKLLYEKEWKDAIPFEGEIIHLGKRFSVKKGIPNYLTLDYLRYSKDGKEYSKPLLYMGIFDILLQERYKGDLYLKYEFEVEKVPSEMEALIEDTHIQEVLVNGNKVEKKGTVLEKDLWSYDVAKFLKEGHNEIIVRIDYFQNDDVYYALFGENVTESLKNCLAYTSTIEAIYLRGDFGVYGDFKDGSDPLVILGENFRVGERKDEIESLILDGYPFFRGSITLAQEVEIHSPRAVLEIKERFQTIRVRVNGMEAGTMMFSNRLDISKYAHMGKNEIELELIVSNRNLLGPFHNIHAEEDPAVGPFTYERTGSWKNGESKHIRPNYSFVKTIL